MLNTSFTLEAIDKNQNKWQRNRQLSPELCWFARVAPAAP